VTASKDASKVPAPTKGRSKKQEKSDEELALDGLMTEIEEDLRSEEIGKLWKKYGNYIIGVVCVVVLAVVGWQFYKQSQEEQRAALTRQYEEALRLTETGKLDEALTAYAAVAAKKGDGMAALAQLQKAALMLEKGDRAGALAAYKALEDDETADILFRDLATVLYTLHALDTENPLQLEANLKPVLDPGSAFTHTATELTALLAYKQGDAPRALKLAEGLLADTKTPPGVRQRAEELAAIFREGAPATTPAATPAKTAPADAPAPATPAVTPSKPDTAPSK
jgi:hypothetical protein